MESPFTPPWSLIIPRLEERARQEGRQDAARIMLQMWEECAQLLLRGSRSDGMVARSLGRQIGEGLRALLGAAAAGFEVQKAWDVIPLPLYFKGRRHSLWRQYMFVKGVALYGYVEEPPLPENVLLINNWLIYRNRHYSHMSWAAQCMIEAGRTGVYSVPAEDSPIFPP